MAESLELVIMRQLGGYLSTPLLVVDARGDLLFFNEAAEAIVGRPFSQTGVIRRGEWSALFKPSNDDGSPVPREEQPLFIATEQRVPASRRSWITGLDGVRREVQGLAFPLLGLDGRLLGAAGVFVQVDPVSSS